MSRTNTFTADAATQTFQAPLRPMMLIGVFQGPDGDYILLRTRSGSILKLDSESEQGGLTLIGTGDGWAMIGEGDAAIHRLVIG